MKATICSLLMFSFLYPSLAFGQTKRHINKKNVLNIAEHYPEFPGGNDSMRIFISTNVYYPQQAIDSNIQGRVIVRFVVDSEGVVSDPEIVKPVHPLLDRAAIDVVEAMPKWKPGEDNGRKVNVYFTLPITFHLEDDKKPKNKKTSTPSKKK